ncbi:MAG: DUF2218 domain-containing protein [Alphaproteobacteria bacterium]|nr:DUF2218 domain-containing protein [Alphaproteobacteria bacterium]MDE2042617.1 DUF2218 domain-containing protein [Alphaproteobacteria bacterium]MDE2339562.1 DUF2218 domain-containing protein [Alphaproteobacteria bacterium]
MSITSNGFAQTVLAERYIQQLVKHWSHRFATSYADGRGEIPFGETKHATLIAQQDGIAIQLTTSDTDEDASMRGVIETHLDRFAFREAPLIYHWDIRS